MAIPDDVIATIKVASDIVDVVGKYVKLTRSSRSSPIWIGSCPFHKETDGSFKVNQQTQSWFCYGCGKGSKDNGNKGSDVFAFIQEIENVDFPTSVELLAERAGIPFSNQPQDPAVEHAKKVVTEHNRRYFDHLWNSNTQAARDAINYLHSRGLTDQTITHFRLGLVPQNELQFRTDITSIAGKLAIPIIELSSSSKPRTLGMSYREPVVKPVNNPKYKNDSTSPCFSKGELLYGLNFAGPSIRKERCGIMVECFFGTMMLHQEGIDNVVSPMGTMLTEQQLILARKFAKKWILLFDGDKAGDEAVLRTLPMMLKLGMVPYFCRLPEGDDADTFIKRVGKEKFKEWLTKNSKPLLESHINETLSEFESKVSQLQVEVLNKIMPLLDNISGSEAEVLNTLIRRRLTLN